MTFRDRTDAGRLLADALVPAPAPPFVVGAIPRGGVTVALPLVERFRAPLTLVYAGKLTAAVAPEFAFGALDADGEAHVEAESVAMLGLSPADVEEAKARVRGEIERRMAAYGAPSLGAQLPGPGVVLVDDGPATGRARSPWPSRAPRRRPRGSSSAPPIASWASSSIRRSRPSASTTSTSRPCRTMRCERCSPARERRPPRRLTAICVVDAVGAGC